MLFAGESEVDLISVADQLKKAQACVLEWVAKSPKFRRVEEKTIVVRCSVTAIGHSGLLEGCSSANASSPGIDKSEQPGSDKTA
jgi:hypothetical protein